MASPITSPLSFGLGGELLIHTLPRKVSKKQTKRSSRLSHIRRPRPFQEGRHSNLQLLSLANATSKS